MACWKPVQSSQGCSRVTELGRNLCTSPALLLWPKAGCTPLQQSLREPLKPFLVLLINYCYHTSTLDIQWAHAIFAHLLLLWRLTCSWVEESLKNICELQRICQDKGRLRSFNCKLFRVWKSRSMYDKWLVHSEPLYSMILQGIMLSDNMECI